jgi:glycosyltransferase involved in cell wall biosynthesis
MPSQIAVCMIVRDEEENLARCLKSLADLGAKFRVTDTGSRDRTVDVARSFGAETRHFPWRDDFSAARNFSIAGVDEEWILALDADQYFSSGEAERILDYLGDGSKVAFNFPYEVEENCSPGRTLKLFRNRMGLRYEGIIHESIRNSLDRFPAEAIGVIPALLKDSGCRTAVLPRKSARDYPLLLREWDRCRATTDRRQMNLAGMFLAKEWFARSKPVEAEALLRELLEAMLADHRARPGPADVVILADLLSFLHQSSRDDDAWQCCKRFEPLFGPHPIFSLYRGVTQMRRRFFAEALDDFKRFESLVESGRLDVAVPKSLLGPELWSYQGICQVGLGELDPAVQNFTKACNRAPENLEYQARLHLASMARHSGAASRANQSWDGLEAPALAQ